MIDLKNIKMPGRQKPSALLGLSLEGSKLDGVVLRVVNGALQLQQTFSVTLTLDPLANDPQLVGREIRNHLDKAEIRERRCVLALPLKWALTTQTRLPELAEADIASFLQIEAERGFHADAATLVTGSSRFKTASGQSVTQAGIPASHIATIESVLRAAGLRPESFSTGITALQPPGNDGVGNDGVLTLVIGDGNVSVQITGGGGVISLRTLEGAVQDDGGRRTLNIAMITRELRITLGQLPEEVRATLRTARVFGARDLAQQLSDEIQLRFEAMDLSADAVTRYSAGEFGITIPAEQIMDMISFKITRLMVGELTGQA